MPQIVPVSDLRADTTSASRHSDAKRERSFARAVLATEAREAAGELEVLSPSELAGRLAASRAARARGGRG